MLHQRYRRSRLTLAGLLLAAALPLGARAHAAAQPYPVLGVDPLPGFVELESFNEALSRWRSRGHRSLALLHIDTRDRTRPLSPGEAAALGTRGATAAASSPAAAAGRSDSFLFETSFVRAAVVAGLVNEVYWIVPFDYLHRPDPVAALRTDLRVAGFTEADLSSFALRDGCVRGRVAGTPFAVCSSKNPPRLAVPVLLDISTDFLLSAAAADNASPFLVTRNFLAGLAERRYAVADAVLCTSLETRYTTRVAPNLRWVGEIAAQAFRDPTFLAQPETSKRWTVLQSAAALLDAGDYTGMLHEILPYLTIHDEDPALHLYYAEALAGQNRLEPAFEQVKLACRLHDGYCYGFAWLGIKRLAVADVDGAETFFAAGERLRPGMLFGQELRGFTLLHAGRRDEAMQVFLALSDAGRPLPGAFLAGALLLKRNDKAAALRQFDKALDALRDTPYLESLDPETALAVQEAVRLYREQGFGEKAAFLENNPWLQYQPAEEPPPSRQP
jgi:tetratricopeptide (TPR) repeat protein